MAIAFDGPPPGPRWGYFTYDIGDDRWSWSDGMYGLHGFEPAEIPATTEALLDHKHPDDRVRAYEVLETAVRTGSPFSCYHRIIDRHKKVRPVLSVGRGLADDVGAVQQLVGFIVDLTDIQRAETLAEVKSALVLIAENRAVIDQAKGMLMFATGCDTDTAFTLLAHDSQRANATLNEIARQIATPGREQANDVQPSDAINELLDDLRLARHCAAAQPA